jgi:hypothetical protein
MNSKRCIVGLLVGCLAGVTPTAVANIGGAIGSNGGGGGGGGGGGLDESAANALYLRQDGTETLKGNLLPDADGTRNIGSTSNRIGTLWVRGINSTPGTGSDIEVEGVVKLVNGSNLQIRNTLSSSSYFTVGTVSLSYLTVRAAAATDRVRISATKLNVCETNSTACGITASGTTHPEVRVTDDAGLCVTTDSGTTCNTTITGAGLIVEAVQAITHTGSETTEPVLNQVTINCTNGGGCTWDFVETVATAGRRFCATNISANTVTINDAAGVRAVQGASIALGENDSACFHYVNSLWVQTSLSDN